MAPLTRASHREPAAGDWPRYPLPGTGERGKITLLTTSTGRGRERRNLLVSLPPGVAPSRSRPSDRATPRPVLYLHDGQNLFDPATSHAGDWGLVATLNQLAHEGIEPIVVGIPNRGRLRQYDLTPFRDLRHGGGGGDRYLDFILRTVKPLIDRSFPTRRGPQHTIIGGSSLGGLISLYALWRHPEVFGAAAALSPALWVANRAIFRFLDSRRLPRSSRIYLDVGTAEGAEALRDARVLRDWLLAAGAVAGRDFRYVEEAGGQHSEAAWGRRLHEALPFLIGAG